MFIPFLLDGLEDPLVLKLSVSMLYDFGYLLSIVLNVVLSKVNYCESGGVFKMWCLHQMEDLHPMSLFEGFTSEFLKKLDYKRGFLDLEHHNFVERSAFLLKKLVL